MKESSINDSLPAATSRIQPPRLGKNTATNEDTTTTTTTTTTLTTTTNSFFGNHDNNHFNDDYDDNDIHNFGTFMDNTAINTAFPVNTNFATTTTTPTTTTTTTTTTTNHDTTFLDTSFDVAFTSSTDVPFDSLFNTTTSTTFTNNSNNNNNNNNMPFTTNEEEDDAFNMNIISDFPGLSLSQQPPPPAPPTTTERIVVYDSKPFTNIPIIKNQRPICMVLQPKLIFEKNFHSLPIRNPSNGNIIFIASSSSSSLTTHYHYSHNSNPYMIYELDPNRDYIPVSSIPLISNELHRVVTLKYNATIQSIQKIWTLTMGLAQSLLSSSSGSHRNNNSNSKYGGLREQLAAIIDLRVLEATTTMRLVVMWERNTISNQFDLYHVTTPPSGGDFASDLSTLQVSDGLLFVGGASPKGSCIFISKPNNHKYHRGGSEAWSANFVTGMGSVLYMSVSMTKPYLVVALADKSITVWTYQSALRNAVGNNEAMDHPSTGGTSSSSKRWLYPLCRLNYNDTLATVQSEYPGINEDDTVMDDTSDVGYCTHMAWLPAAPSGSSLLLLSVTFDNALVIFHVDLPLRKDNATDKEYKPFPEPTQSTVIAATPILSPIVAKRWKGKYDHSFATWFQYGSVTDTCIAILLHDALQPLARVLLCAVHFPLKTVGPLTKREKLLACRILSSTTIPKSDITFPTGLLHSFYSLISYSKQTMSTITLSTTTPGSTKISHASFLSHPVTSNPSGLSSTGEPFMSDTHMDHDGVLFIYTTVHCERETNTADVTHLHWSLPKRRFWLCRAVAGDTMESSLDEVKEETGFGESYQVLGGANAQLIYELNDAALKGLVPFRIVRGWKRNVCAVLFRCALGTVSPTSQSMSFMADCIVLVDYTGERPSIAAAPGRDVAFFPGHNSNNAQGLILSLDGSSVTFFDFDPTNGLTTTSSFRPLLGVHSDSDYVDCQRILIFSDDTILNLAVLGTRFSDNRVCFVAGDVGGVAEATTKGCSNLLPNLATDRSFIFDEGEDVFAIIGLQGDGSGYRNFAMTTSYRILILSSSLSVSAESVHDRASGLSPIGSFAVCYASNNKIRYLCCLDEEMATGVMASVGHSSHNPSPSVLIGVRPDRLILYSSMSASCLCEPAQNCDLLSFPVPSTRPVLLLEPMIANAVCIGQKKHQSTPILHHVIEKFGRRISSIAHGENEGIGSFGAGLTPGCFAILRKYELLEAASWLLTGTIKFDKSANTRLLPPWLPIGPKSVGALNSDAMLHLLANGDSSFSDYIKSPERGIVSRLPRQTDPSALLSREYAQKQLRSGNQLDALKLLDVSGAEASENLALLVALTMDTKHNPDSLNILKSLSGSMSNRTPNRSEQGKASTSLAALAELSKGSGISDMKDGIKEVGSWASMLAPSLQRSKLCSRSRQSLLRRGSVEVNSTKIPSDPVWNSQCNESKHVWNEGPRKEKENLLLLDNIEDWLGRRRPLIFGKEGASAVKDRGEKTLADILNQEDDSFGAMQDDLENVKGDGWIDGVGEGRSDEANLSAYFRMSEGDDIDNSWRMHGFLDISPYQNKALVICDPLTVDLQHSTCSVDEGEVGKVKSLFDLVFAASGQGIPSGLSLPAPRGSSLDIGVLHFSDREARKKSTVEFWFFLPEVDKIFDEIVVIRRTWGSNADDMTKVAISSDRQNMLWELLLRRTGAFEFRTCGGSSLIDSSLSKGKLPQDSSEEATDASCLAVFGRWNHVCLVLNSRGMQLFECNATLYVKGVKALTGMTRVLPLNDDIKHWSEGSTLNEAMEKSCLLFGLNHCADFRLTELRVWSCERSAEDIQSFLYEYLNAAEQKKKFKVKITNKKNKIGTALSTQKGLFGNKKKSDDGITQTLSSGGIVFSLKPQKPSSPTARTDTGTISTALNAEFASPVNTGATNIAHLRKEVNLSDTIDQQGNPADAVENEGEDRNLDDNEDVAVTLWDSAIPLSQQLRPSAAAALIRGPPATRHYGGNRGGLPDFSGVDRVGVGGIAICGSEKTIVFRDNEDPPAVTYPIGASGAVVSDQMDDEGSEFLCCFLAKEGRMVVFELRSRTVVVELQMTTKLNFWRYLPPEAAFNSLCYMLVTPVGGFHWKPLEESPRPHQVWKRGPELQGKKVVNYEEGGSNGGGNDDICSRVGLITVTRSTGGSLLEGWILPILGDSKPKPLPTNILGACLCQPLFIDDTEPFLPILITVEKTNDGQLTVNATAMREPNDGSIFLSDVIASQVIDDYDAGGTDFVPPALAMGPLPEALCVSLSNIVVVIIRRKGLVAAFEYEENGLNIIAMECVDHFVIDAVMRYSADVGGAEIVMLLSDDNNEKDGRIVSFCFRSTD